MSIFKFALRDDLQDTGDLFLPKRGEPLATGYDVRAAQVDRKNIILRAGQYAKIPLGFRAFCPEGWYYQLHPRSSSFAKKYIHSLIGVIDQTYENEVLWAVQYLPDVSSLATDLVIKFGDAIGQIIPIKREDVMIENVSNQEFNKLCGERQSIRSGGFGSTDVK